MINLLEKSDKPLSRLQIAKALEITAISISLVLKRMLKYNDIKCIELDRFQSAKMLGWSSPWRRTRFYYSSSTGSKGFPSLAKGK